jgi:hypothetical protein
MTYIPLMANSIKVDDMVSYSSFIKMLLHCEGAEGSTSIIESSSAALPVTASGNAKITLARSKLGTGSISLDGNTSSKVTVNNSSGALALGTSDFTLEGYFYFTTISAGYQPLICASNSGDGQGPVLIMETNNRPTFIVSTTGSGWAAWVQADYPPTLGWNHIAVVRYGPRLMLFLNGVRQATGSYMVNTGSIFSSATWHIGHYPYFPGGARTLNGNVDEVCLTVGKAKYLDSFVPPTIPFLDPSPPAFPKFGEMRRNNDGTVYLCTNKNTNTWIPKSSAKVYKADNGRVEFLCNLNGPNGSTTFTDVGPNQMPILVGAGSPVISTTRSKFGNGSLYLNGSSYLRVDNLAQVMNLASKNFTIEYFLYQETRGSSVSVGGFQNNSDQEGPLLTLSSGYPQVWYNLPTSSTWTNFQGTSTIPTGQWNHYALTRSQNIFTHWLNGTAIGTMDLGDRISTSNNFYIGGYPGYINWTGYMEQVRVTIGRAMYQKAFTPPAGPFTYP